MQNWKKLFDYFLATNHQFSPEPGRRRQHLVAQVLVGGWIGLCTFRYLKDFGVTNSTSLTSCWCCHWFYFCQICSLNAGVGLLPGVQLCSYLVQSFSLSTMSKEYIHSTPCSKLNITLSLSFFSSKHFCKRHFLMSAFIRLRQDCWANLR